VPNTVSVGYAFVVNAPVPPLQITSVSPPPATVGQAYSFTFVAVGGVPPYQFALSPSIPGLSLDASTGVLSGTPTTAGTTTITVSVTDSAP
jgi:hypothetical protein